MLDLGWVGVGEESGEVLDEKRIFEGQDVQLDGVVLVFKIELSGEEGIVLEYFFLEGFHEGFSPCLVRTAGGGQHQDLLIGEILGRS